MVLTMKVCFFFSFWPDVVETESLLDFLPLAGSGEPLAWCLLFECLVVDIGTVYWPVIAPFSFLI